MIITETLTINGRTFVHTYSDSGYMIKQGGTGATYSEAYDPADIGRTYTETDESIESETDTDDYKTAFEILTGGVEV